MNQTKGKNLGIKPLSRILAVAFGKSGATARSNPRAVNPLITSTSKAYSSQFIRFYCMGGESPEGDNAQTGLSLY